MFKYDLSHIQRKSKIEIVKTKMKDTHENYIFYIKHYSLSKEINQK